MPEDISTLLKDMWSPLLAVSTAAGAVIGYLITHRRELSWKRTEFICTQSQYLDTDADLIAMVEILEGRNPQITIDQIYDDNSEVEIAVRDAYKQRFDRLLNFLWRLCFAYLMLKTLTRREIVCVGWYLRRIAIHPSLVNYCNRHGYNDVITVIDRQGYSRDARNLQSPPPGKSSDPTAR